MKKVFASVLKVAGGGVVVYGGRKTPAVGTPAVGAPAVSIERRLYDARITEFEPIYNTAKRAAGFSTPAVGVERRLCDAMIAEAVPIYNTAKRAAGFSTPAVGAPADSFRENK